MTQRLSRDGRAVTPETVRLRPLGRSDVRQLRDALATGAIAATTRRLFPRSLPSMLDWYDHLHRSTDTSAFAIVHGSRFIGYCALRPPIFHGRELAIAIFDHRYRGKGVGTIVVDRLCRFAFERLKVGRIELGVYPSNRRAVACYMRCGFRHEALLRRFLYHDGEWADVVLMSRLRSKSAAKQQ